MIFKKRTSPLYLLQLQALLRRLPNTHLAYPKVEYEHAKQMKGHRGEEAVEYYLSFLPKDTYSVFHNVRLPYMNSFNKVNYFQIDTLLATKAELILLEIKNVSGTLHVDYEHNQMVRTVNDVEEGFPNALLQVKLQERQLRTWLVQYELQPRPMRSYVVISKPSTILRSTGGPDTVTPSLIHAAQIPYLFTDEPLSASEPSQLIDIKQLQQLILSDHRPFYKDILKYFNVSPQDLVTGVVCKECETPSMKWWWGRWRCQACDAHDRQAHIQSIKEYVLLVNSSFTSAEIRAFLRSENRQQTHRFIKSFSRHYPLDLSGRLYHCSLSQLSDS
ncbi:nuclease-related domain-containing protein [Salsuginibacillus kocurii]|uniref:nuclease-related domain-containing protein n=1 Tax=Salsuginibacillus kocurii TaxID=427078 RepID=UPI0003679BDE|nr:NERD domain-containing protein [Salsuginibacillus kocurii]